MPPKTVTRVGSPPNTPMYFFTCKGVNIGIRGLRQGRGQTGSFTIKGKQYPGKGCLNIEQVKVGRLEATRVGEKIGKDAQPVVEGDHDGLKMAADDKIRAVK